jgi:hypothetical protein
VFLEETTFIRLKTFLALLNPNIFSNKYEHNDINKSKDKNRNNELITMAKRFSSLCHMIIIFIGFIDFLPGKENNERKKRKDEGRKTIDIKGQRKITKI